MPITTDRLPRDPGALAYVMLTADADDPSDHTSLHLFDCLTEQHGCEAGDIWRAACRYYNSVFRDTGEEHA
ncbi:hypothetical protein [Streptomyces mobaraensis]|uniref:Uncharacterized protein n=1 Tax=Streptomyces mobaraensis TaxID=35621 RepID=A0A5N5W3X8_STRMB|nr:hypothetical protein [Streptomyces mobaraensis]KAB7839474.1 hypothetical protein FRZ00_21265 [Streptomyces mobaraensis]